MKYNSSECFSYSKDSVDYFITCSKCNAHFPEESDTCKHIWTSIYSERVSSESNTENDPNERAKIVHLTNEINIDENQSSNQVATGGVFVYDQSLRQERFSNEELFSKAMFVDASNFCMRCRIVFEESFELHHHVLLSHRRKRLFKPDTPDNSDSEERQSLSKKFKTEEKITKSKKQTSNKRRNRNKNNKTLDIEWEHGQCGNDEKKIVFIDQLINWIDQELDEK